MGVSCLHRRSNVDDLAIAEAAVAGELIPDATADPCRVVVAESVNRVSCGAERVIRFIIRIDKIAEESFAIPVRSGLRDGEAVGRCLVTVADGYGTWLVSERADLEAAGLPSR